MYFVLNNIYVHMFAVHAASSADVISSSMVSVDISSCMGANVASVNYCWPCTNVRIALCCLQRVP